MDAFLGEIRVFPYNYCPQGFVECNGQELQVSLNQALYAVIGNTYGGTAPTTLAVPNLNGTVVIDSGQGPGLTNYPLKTAVGVNSVTLTELDTPNHTHTVTVKRSQTFATENVNTPAGNDLAQILYTGAQVAVPSYNQPANTFMSPAAVTTVGGGAPHENRQPFLALRFCICTDGEFPVRPS